MSLTSKLATRQLGKDGPEVDAIGLGLMGLSAFYGTTESDEDRFAVLDLAFESGQTNWDSADCYGDSEILLGKWFKRTGKRSKIFLATKFAWDVSGPEWVLRTDPDYVKYACAQSLEKLGVECIDLYYCHRVDKKTPIEKTVQAMVDLKNEGKIKYLGLSECSAETLRRACAVHHISAVQMEYSPFATDIENPQWGIMKTARELGVAIVIYSPLGRGFLTGNLKSPDDLEADDMRHSDPRFSKENFPNNLALVDSLKAMAEKKGCTAGQLVLAWELAQGDDIIAIPGTKKTKNLMENIKALEVKLTTAEVMEIRQAIEACIVHGERLSPIEMTNVIGDTPPLT